MVKLRISLFILFSGIGLAQAQLSPKEIAVLKANMVKAIESSKLTDSLFKRLNKLPNKTALVTGYTGTLEALKAKHSWNPYNKIKFVSRSLKTMKKAIDMDKEDMEIRFMRFSIEFYTPSFLGFSKDLAEDKKEIVKHYQNGNFGLADEELVRNVAKFMIDSKRCTDTEIKIFKKHL
ncbi:hypothetical protein G7074_12350 [Pedobacter sp. HDW13]|uniref:hypothetical protein n=1 Tax=unclassified Pedobacter TaxID=2628915 RepID=UPI000F591520|nr:MULTISPECIES: hypothetical protein [unclassified Pedobacter]QIL39985.1 hypothetical protein G7074_12350 [Pedobacter sp. HDW13]RQO64261.1 hypothetical protein DBR40_26115 [Pedobacter sp. KBW01]